MKIGDLVRLISPDTTGVPLVEENWRGVVIGWTANMPIVYWNDKFPSEVEYREQLEVISECG